MFSTGTPLADRTDTNVCLISRGAQPCPSPAFSVSVRNARITLFALSGVPTVDEKTRPWSCQSGPGAQPVLGLELPVLAERLDAAPGERQGPAVTSPVLVSPPCRCGAPDMDREAVFAPAPGVIEPGRGDRLPPARIVRPRHHVIPPQGPGLFSADAGQQAQRHVGVHARALGGGQQGLRLLQREALRRPARPAPRGLHQGGDVASDEIVGLGVPDSPVQRVAGDLEGSGGVAGCELAQR